MSLDVVIVAGNGESRKSIDLENYNEYTKIGCNAIHRDHTVDHLVCCDQRMVREALTNSKVTSVYTRERYYRDFKKIQKIKTVKLLPDVPTTGRSKADNPEHWGSGPYAVLLACHLGFNEIKMIGFDLYGLDDKINNIYKGTDHYLKSSAPYVDPSFWIYQIKYIFHSYPEKKFQIFNNTTWRIPDSWKQPNVEFLELKFLTPHCKEVKYVL